MNIIECDKTSFICNDKPNQSKVQLWLGRKGEQCGGTVDWPLMLFTFNAM